MTDADNDGPTEQVSLRRIRKECKAILSQRTRYITNDCMMFWRVRLEQPKWHRKHGASKEKLVGLGGGNFTMLNSLMAACNLLAKAYSWLVKPDVFITAEQRKAAKEAIGVARIDDKFKAAMSDSKTQWKLPRVGDCNEV